VKTPLVDISKVKYQLGIFDFAEVSVRPGNRTCGSILNRGTTTRVNFRMAAQNEQV
jgi:hypothetical protein